MDAFVGLLALVLGMGMAPGEDPSPPGVVRLEAPGIENLHKLGDRLYSGGQPTTDASFAALARMGIKTIVSVDGTKPDVAKARRHGLRYAHLPIGYDGIASAQASRLVKAARDLPGPVFIHCHHGKHRGPAAAALVALSLQGWTHDQALSWLGRAGTSREYAGLFRVVRDFRPPAPALLDALPADWPEVAPVPPLVEAMVDIDACWDHLKLVKAAGFRSTPAHPDIDPAQEAKLLAEHFRELARTDEARRRGDDFTARLAASSADAEALSALLKTRAAHPDDPTPLPHAIRLHSQLERACVSCHARNRDARVPMIP